jgi:hypothetical protein
MDLYNVKPIRLSYPTPLGDAFLCDFNVASIQNSIKSQIKSLSGVTIRDQNYADLKALMRSVYSDLVRDPYTNVRAQVSAMNSEVVKRAIPTISTGILQQAVYLRDISSQPVPMPAPISTTTYGNKLPINTKYGFT